MNLLRHRVLCFCCAAVALLALWAFSVPSLAAQSPATTLIPIAVDTAAPIVVNAVKPKPKPLPAGIVKFEGYVMHANSAQITVRATGNDMALETFALDKNASAKMQQTMDRGGYQYGDKVTVFYNAANQVAVKIKGRPSRPL
jgi:hypothetical protein